MEFKDTLINDIGNVKNPEDLLLKAILCLLYYQIKTRKEEPEEEIKESYSLQDALDTIYKKRDVGVTPSPS